MVVGSMNHDIDHSRQGTIASTPEGRYQEGTSML